jgi:hypothetical protein
MRHPDRKVRNQLFKSLFLALSADVEKEKCRRI